jgi:hypothetical protein
MRIPALLALLCGLAAACPSTVNQDACRAYVEHLNGLACRDDVDADATCPAAYDADGAVNCADYFACLTSAARCDGDTFVNEAATACASCEVPE